MRNYNRYEVSVEDGVDLEKGLLENDDFRCDMMGNFMMRKIVYRVLRIEFKIFEVGMSYAMVIVFIYLC